MQTKPDEDAHKRSTPGKRLIILSDAEKRALYGLPEFDDFQRIEFFAMTDAERTTALQRKGLEEQIWFCRISHADMQLGQLYRASRVAGRN